MPLEAIDAIATSTRTVGLTCGHEWTVTPSAQIDLRAFAARMREEIALAAP